jgi:hypothetical protein
VRPVGSYVRPVCAPGDPPVNTTAPFVPSVFDWIVIVPPSKSMSLKRTSIAVGPAPSGIVFASFRATGGSSTHVTVTMTVAVDPPLSVYVNGSLPQKFVSGV